MNEELNDKEIEELKKIAIKVGRSIIAWYGSGPVDWSLTSSLSLGAGPVAGKLMRFHRKRLRKKVVVDGREGGVREGNR